MYTSGTKSVNYSLLLFTQVDHKNLALHKFVQGISKFALSEGSKGTNIYPEETELRQKDIRLNTRPQKTTKQTNQKERNQPAVLIHDYVENVSQHFKRHSSTIILNKQYCFGNNIQEVTAHLVKREMSRLNILHQQAQQF